MMDTEALIQSATDLGAERGHAAGTWVVDGNTSRETCEAIVRMDEDGDPALWDMLPSSPLSGEWADSLTPRSLCEMLMGDENDPEYDADLADDLCSAYEQAWYDAVRDEAVRSASDQIA